MRMITVAETLPFLRKIQSLLSVEERADLIAYLAEHPSAGVVIQGTGVIRKINLRVHVNNLRAIKLYERFGFKVEGRITREYSVDGQFYDNLAMGLHID